MKKVIERKQICANIRKMKTKKKKIEKIKMEIISVDRFRF